MALKSCFWKFADDSRWSFAKACGMAADWSRPVARSSIFSWALGCWWMLVPMLDLEPFCWGRGSSHMIILFAALFSLLGVSWSQFASPWMLRRCAPSQVDGMQFIFYPLGYRDSTEVRPLQSRLNTHNHLVKSAPSIYLSCIREDKSASYPCFDFLNPEGAGTIQTLSGIIIWSMFLDDWLPLLGSHRMSCCTT